MMKKKIKKNSGQLLIEAAVALSVVLFALTGLFSLSNQALGLTGVLADQYAGANLAAEGIELMRRFIEGNVLLNCAVAWNEGIEETLPDEFYEIDFTDTSLAFKKTNGPGTPLRFEPINRLYVYNNLYIDEDGDSFPTDASKFKRKIHVNFEQIGGVNDVIVLQSVVEWKTRGAREEKVTIEAHYYNWQKFTCP